MKLIHSPHDNGYYYEKFENNEWSVSQLFKTESEAHYAKLNNKLKFENG